jgi:hypothetical protein
VADIEQEHAVAAACRAHERRRFTGDVDEALSGPTVSVAVANSSVPLREIDDR